MKREVKIGFFFGGALILLAVLVLFVGDVRHLFNEKGYPLYAHFENVAGLEKRTIVRMAGVKIGYVEDIRLKGVQAEVLMLVDHEVKVRKDSIATQAALGLLGEKYIEIQPGEMTEVCQPGDSIGGIASLSFDQIGSRLVGFGDEIKSVGDTLMQFINGEDTPNNLVNTLGEISRFVGEFKVFLEDNRSGIGGTVQQATETIENLGRKVDEVSSSLEGLISKVKEAVEENRGDLKTGVTKLNELFLQIEESLVSLNEAIKKLNKGEGTLGRLLHDPELYTETKETVETVQKIVAPLSTLRMRAHLNSYYYGKSGKVKGQLGVEFWPDPARFILAQVVRDPWEEAFTYTAQGGWRWGDFSARAGILESRFGAAVDYYGWDDRLRVSVEGYDFNRESRPHFRIWASFSPVRHFYLWAGLDDFTLAPRREFFIGFGFGL